MTRKPVYKKPQGMIRLDRETLDDLQKIAKLLRTSVSGLIRQYTREMLNEIEKAEQEVKQRSLFEGLAEIALEPNTPPEKAEQKQIAASLICIIQASQELDGLPGSDPRVIQRAIDNVNDREWEDPAYKAAILEFLNETLDGVKNPQPAPESDAKYKVMLADQWRRVQEGDVKLLGVMSYERRMEPDKFTAALPQDILADVLSALYMYDQANEKARQKVGTK